MIRTFGVNGGVLALAALPMVVLITTGGEDTPKATEPDKAALTLRLEGDDGSREHPKFFRVWAVGPPPASSSSLSDGEHNAFVRPSRGRRCTTARVHFTGLEGKPASRKWCLRIVGADMGSEVEGEAEGPSTTLALTVSRRHSFWFLPFGALALGLILGAGASVLPGPVRRLISKHRLEQLRTENRSAKPSVRINGLDAWADARLGQGHPASSLMAVIEPVVRNGPGRAAAARTELRHELDHNRLPDELRLVQGARDEGNRREHNVSDFIDQEGKPKTHPASAWLAAIRRVREIVTLVQAEQREISALAAHCRTDPQARLAEAETTLEDIASPEEMTRMDDRLRTLRTTIENMKARADCEGVRPAEAEAAEVLPLPGPFEAPAPLVLGGLRRRIFVSLRGAVLVAFTAAVFVGLLAIAAYTAYLAAFQPNHTFAVWKDYFGLGAAAWGSALLGGALGVFAWWKSESTSPAA